MVTLKLVTDVMVMGCPTCGGPIAMTALQQKELRRTHGTFYCPVGHTGHYLGITEEERLRAELISAQDRATAAETREVAANTLLRIVEKKHMGLAKRIAAGVCPNCHRTFSNVQRHMETKHPDR